MGRLWFSRFGAKFSLLDSVLTDFGPVETACWWGTFFFLFSLSLLKGSGGELVHQSAGREDYFTVAGTLVAFEMPCACNKVSQLPITLSAGLLLTSTTTTTTITTTATIASPTLFSPMSGWPVLPERENKRELGKLDPAASSQGLETHPQPWRPAIQNQPLTDPVLASTHRN